MDKVRAVLYNSLQPTGFCPAVPCAKHSQRHRPLAGSPTRPPALPPACLARLSTSASAGQLCWACCSSTSPPTWSSCAGSGTARAAASRRCVPVGGWVGWGGLVKHAAPHHSTQRFGVLCGQAEQSPALPGRLQLACRDVGGRASAGSQQPTGWLCFHPPTALRRCPIHAGFHALHAALQYIPCPCGAHPPAPPHSCDCGGHRPCLSACRGSGRSRICRHQLPRDADCAGCCSGSRGQLPGRRRQRAGRLLSAAALGAAAAAAAGGAMGVPGPGGNRGCGRGQRHSCGGGNGGWDGCAGGTGWQLGSIPRLVAAAVGG